jgi:hypothetical protein
MHIDPHAWAPWLVAAAAFVIGAVWLRQESRAFARVWESLSEQIVEVRQP